MAKFKVGDRVRVRSKDAPNPKVHRFDGHEGILLGLCSVYPGNWDVSGIPEASFHECRLEPLTPPAIDQWAKEAVKRVTKPRPLPEIIAEHDQKVKV